MDEDRKKSIKKNVELLNATDGGCGEQCVARELLVLQLRSRTLKRILDGKIEIKPRTDGRVMCFPSSSIAGCWHDSLPDLLRGWGYEDEAIASESPEPDRDGFAAAVRAITDRERNGQKRDER